MSKSNALETADLTYWFTTGAPGVSRPTAWFAALHTSDPGEAAAATEVDATVDDTAYARQSVAFTVAGNVASNSAQITFPAVIYGTGAAPYTVTHFSIWDASSGGTLLRYGALGSPKELSALEQLSFDAGDITLTED